MTLDEAIEHAQAVADKKEREKQKWERWLETDSDYRAVNEKVSCELCAEEHRQLADWLKDYKRLKEQEPCEGIAKAFQIGLAFGFGEKHDEINKVIDDIKKAITPQQKIGRWEWVKYDGNPNIGNWHCSECNRIVCGAITPVNPVYAYKYCPECGAKMESEDKV